MRDTYIKLATLAGALDLQATFERYRLGWITQPVGFYCLEIVWEFYPLYVISIYLITPNEGKGMDQPALTHTLVRRVGLMYRRRQFIVSYLGWIYRVGHHRRV